MKRHIKFVFASTQIYAHEYQYLCKISVFVCVCICLCASMCVCVLYLMGPKTLYILLAATFSSSKMRTSARYYSLTAFQVYRDLSLGGEGVYSWPLFHSFLLEAAASLKPVSSLTFLWSLRPGLFVETDL